MPPHLVVSMGDPCGIGPDIVIKAWSETGGQYLPEFFVIGSGKVLEERAQLLGVDLKITTPENRDDATALPVMEIENACAGNPGHPEKPDALATIEAIEKGVAFVANGSASGLVTCPINKKNLYEVGFVHPGHTEFLAELANDHYGDSHTPVMMLAGPELRTVPVTIHIPLSQVPSMLTTELIIECGKIVAQDLKSRFGIEKPRLAIAGLNPHAGEGGALGEEDDQIIKPAVDTLRTMEIDAVGPLPADTMFHAKARQTYDVALCMYHDQALIPAKMIGFDDSANVTLGLPFIRTSPDHGTAYDIAGTGKANPSSFIAALKTAAQMAEKS